MNRYPDPDATLLRRRIAERYETEPGRVAVGNGSCEILLAAAEALCEPGAEIVYAWPSFSMYPYLAALTGAREIRVPLAEGDVHDLDAMAAEVTAATQLLIVCNPNNPTGDPHPRRPRSPPSASGSPTTSRSILDEAYIEFQTDTTTPTPPSTCSRDFPNLVVLRTFSKCYGLAGLRVGYAIGSAKFRAAVDAVRQPFSVNALAQAAGRRGGPALRRRRAPGREHDRRARPRRGGPRRARPRDRRHPGQLLLDRPRRRRRGGVVAGLAERAIAVRPGTPLGGPGHIRVTYGTRAENERFLARRRSASCSTNARATCYKLMDREADGHTPRAAPRRRRRRAPALPTSSYYWRFS